MPCHNIDLHLVPSFRHNLSSIQGIQWTLQVVYFRQPTSSWANRSHWTAPRLHKLTWLYTWAFAPKCMQPCQFHTTMLDLQGVLAVSCLFVVDIPEMENQEHANYPITQNFTGLYKGIWHNITNHLICYLKLPLESWDLSWGTMQTAPYLSISGNSRRGLSGN